MREYLAAFAMFLAASAAEAVPPLQEAAAKPELRPLTVAVVDGATGAPVTEFTYRARFQVPGRQRRADDGDLPKAEAWTPVASPAGTFEIPAPPACWLDLQVKAPDYYEDRSQPDEFLVRSDDPRRVVVRMLRGVTIRGTVRDSRTLRPIAGAKVTPRFSGPMIYGFDDEDKAVVTGDDGRYEVRGADSEWGVHAEHPDYEDDPAFADGPKGDPNRDFFMKRLATVAIAVVDTDGRPLAGAAVHDIWKEGPVAGEDGRLVVKVRDALSGLTIRMDGFIEAKLEAEEAQRRMDRPEALVVVMEPTIKLTGRVVGPDGRAVEAFRAAAGPGPLPGEFDCEPLDVRDREGRFTLGLPAEGPAWVGVVAEGFAAWEGLVDVRRGGGPLEVRLSAGATVTARVEGPEARRNRTEATLVPRRERSQVERYPSEALAASFASRKAVPDAEGGLRFEHVRPDRYRLVLARRGAPETALTLDVPADGLDVGAVPLATPAATGRIEGRVWRPQDEGGGPWAFARGYVGRGRLAGLGEAEDEISFLADEEGRFQLDGVPTGLVEVGFPFQFFDVIDAHVWTAQVAAERTTTIGAFEPEGGRKFTLAFAIGDGSDAQHQSGTGLGAARKVDNVTEMAKSILEAGAGREPREPMFRVELTPLADAPLAFARPDWEGLDDARKIVLPDVGPGVYRLRVFDWLGSTDLDGGPMFDAEVAVPEGGRGEVRIPLGAGCITGKVHASEEGFRRPVEVTALAKGAGAPSRRSRCDGDGNFCVRYLTPGTYSLFIHDPDAGYRRVDDVEVPAGVVDLGELTLSPGATAEVAIAFARPTRVPDEVVAVDPSGVSVRRKFESDSSFDRIAIPSLWPGRWTVSARAEGEVVATGEVEVAGEGAFPVALTTGRPTP